jgi:hypothetical protein
MGKALDELVAVRYLSRWDIQKMATAAGYKVVLWPGTDILRCLNSSSTLMPGTPTKNLSLDRDTTPTDAPEFTVESQEALMALLSLGVLPNTAKSLIKQYEPNYILDLAEYAAHLANGDKSGKIGNPAGLLIYWLRNDMPVPSSFETSRRRKATESVKRQRAVEEQQRLAFDIAYTEWKDHQVERELAVRFPGEELSKKLREIVEQRRKSDDLFARVRQEQHPILARQILQKELREQMALPSFEDWCKTHAQYDLFQE